MKIHILLNGLDYGDGVSNFCILLRKRCEELGFAAQIYANWIDERVARHGVPAERLSGGAAEGDILIQNIANDTALTSYAYDFPGRRILFYQNITPVQFFPNEARIRESCRNGLRLVRSLTTVYDLAVAASEFSRRDLIELGYTQTASFPLFVDIEGLREVVPNCSVVEQPSYDGETFLSVNRIAPNKRIEDLLKFLASYRSLGRRARLVLAGNDAQLPEYKEELIRLARKLKLKVGEDVLFTGKLPVDCLVAHYRTADAFLSMSEHEGFGLPLIESMAFGLPVFAYASTAVEETLGGAGFIFRSKDFSAMVKMAAGTMDDPVRKAELLRSQERRLQFFSAESDRRRLSELLGLIESLPRRRTPPAPRKVSVIINTYNRANCLQRCVESLESQTYREFEVVVVNGPSTDDTEQRIAAFGERVRAAETPLRVLTVSRNVGICEARGELVAFLDDDAVAHPNWLRDMVSAFEDPAVGAVGATVYRMNGQGPEFRNGIMDRFGVVQWVRQTPGTHWDWEDGYLNTVSCGSAMFRRSALEQIGGFDEQIEYYNDESDVVMRLRMAGYKTVHRPLAAIYHEAVKSYNRRTKFDLNWYAIIKNTFYCPLKNYTGSEARWRVVPRVLRTVWRLRLRESMRWWFRREIGLGLFLRVEFRSLAGVIAGVLKGLRPAPVRQKIPPVPDGEGIRRFTTGSKRGISVCLLSQCLPPAAPGGIGTYTVNLARGLQKAGCRVHVISRGSGQRSENRGGIWYHEVAPLPYARQAGLSPDFPVVSKNVDYSFAVWKKVLDIAARWGLDVVEAPIWDAEGIVPALDGRIPVVVRLESPLFKIIETHGWEKTPDLRLACDLEGEVLRHAAGVIAISQAIGDLVLTHYGVKPQHSTVIPLGLDLPVSDAAPSARPGRSVLFVGRLEPRKGIDVLLRAIPRILRAVPDAVFDIVGKDVSAVGPDGATLVERWARENREATGRVRFRGEVPDAELGGYYRRCDLFVAPSVYESFGLVYVEAMAHGKPVVGTTAGGIPEVVRNGETGLLVRPGDPGELADAVIRLLQNDALRSQLAQAAHDRYESDFSAQRMAERSLAFYCEVIAAHAASREEILRVGALEALRPPEIRVVCDPVTKEFNLLGEAGARSTLCYGPFVSLGPGAYRAEFVVSALEFPPAREAICELDVRTAVGQLVRRRLSERDFIGGPASIFDLFFTVEEDGAARVEFRVHSTGAGAVQFRDVRVTRWLSRSGSPAEALRALECGAV